MQFYVELPVSKMALEEMRHGISPLKHVIHLKGVLSTILFHRIVNCIVPAMDCEDTHCRFPVVESIKNTTLSDTLNLRVDECVKELRAWFTMNERQQHHPNTPPGRRLEDSSSRRANPGPDSTISLKLSHGGDNNRGSSETWTIASKMSSEYKLVIEGNGTGEQDAEYGCSSQFEYFLLSLGELCYEMGKKNPPQSQTEPAVDIYVGPPDQNEFNDFHRWKRLIKKMF
ncbi:LANO_0G13432g1_1 [Lachancea nothofagi CBS 11611]|uniref:LANO_0G13432g1_1 n=1 Tax=Lachancea nothofagi CBS 11611 TaxID=1266666 RepID=A0A1G4KKF8_9SACH|nr:LANO_0G13432g1_1 [Lachancea nothofagi CBS 11611]